MCTVFDENLDPDGLFLLREALVSLLSDRFQADGGCVRLYVANHSTRFRAAPLSLSRGWWWLLTEEEVLLMPVLYASVWRTS